MPAQPLQHRRIDRPGRNGINSAAGGGVLGPEWASVAQNLYIDKLGRLRSRYGTEEVNTSWTLSAGSGAGTIGIADTNNGEHLIVFSNDGTKIWANAAIGDLSTSQDISGGTNFSDGEVECVSFNGKAIASNILGTLKVWDGNITAPTTFADVVYAAGTANNAYLLHSAFGRLWAVISGTRNTIKYSALLDETTWSGAGTGTVDMYQYWKDTDSIQQVTSFGNKLVVFGKKNIAFFSSPDDPTNLALEDIISGTGVVSRHTVVDTGNDLIYLDKDGVRSVTRAIQYENNPLNEVGRNARELQQEWIEGWTGSATQEQWRGTFARKDGLAIWMQREQKRAIVLNTQVQLADGSFPITVWQDLPYDEIIAYDVDQDVVNYYHWEKGENFFDKMNKDIYDDKGTGIECTFFSPWLLTNPEGRTIIPKNLRAIVYATGEMTLNFKWAYDFNANLRLAQGEVDVTSGTEFGVGEYGIDIYGTGSRWDKVKVPISGSGEYMAMGVNVNTNGEDFGISDLALQFKAGRVTD